MMETDFLSRFGSLLDEIEDMRLARLDRLESAKAGLRIANERLQSADLDKRMEQWAADELAELRSAEAQYDAAHREFVAAQEAL
jgi:hypothetical protein